VEVESTIRPAKDRIAGFEGRGDHRTSFASGRSIAWKVQGSGASGRRRERLASEGEPYNGKRDKGHDTFVSSSVDSLGLPRRKERAPVCPAGAGPRAEDRRYTLERTGSPRKASPTRARIAGSMDRLGLLHGKEKRQSEDRPLHARDSSHPRQK
jgi:hypothetical protein